MIIDTTNWIKLLQETFTKLRMSNKKPDSTKAYGQILTQKEKAQQNTANYLQRIKGYNKTIQHLQLYESIAKGKDIQGIKMLNQITYEVVKGIIEPVEPAFVTKKRLRLLLMICQHYRLSWLYKNYAIKLVPFVEISNIILGQLLIFFLFFNIPPPPTLCITKFDRLVSIIITTQTIKFQSKFQILLKQNFMNLSFRSSDEFSFRIYNKQGRDRSVKFFMPFEGDLKAEDIKKILLFPLT